MLYLVQVMPFWLSDYKRLESTLLCLSSRLLSTKREKSLTRSKLQRKLKFCSTSCTTEEKRREKERKHPWRFKGKTSTRAFLTQLTHKLSKKVALQPRANYASCAERCCELKGSFSRPLRSLATEDLALRLAQEVARDEFAEPVELLREIIAFLVEAALTHPYQGVVGA